MTIQECYENLNSNYNDVANRFAGSRALVLKFAKKFCDDPSYQLLADSMAGKDYKEAFRAAHTIKGVCANLGFDVLFKVSSELTELLRNGVSDEAAVEAKFNQVTEEYHKTIDMIDQVTE